MSGIQSCFGDADGNYIISLVKQYSGGTGTTGYTGPTGATGA